MSTKFNLNELKLAIINEDFKKLEELSKKEPEFSSLEEAIEIQALLKKVIEMLTQKKQEVFKEMQHIKKLQKFQEKKEVQKFDFKG